MSLAIGVAQNPARNLESMRFMPRMMSRLLLIVLMVLGLAACGGGDGGGGSSSGGSSSGGSSSSSSGGSSSGGSSSGGTVTLTNFTTVTVDAGPSALNTGPSAYTATNIPYVTVTICAPGTSTCQTIDHVLLDTGSVGLRVLQPVLSSTLLAALPNQTDGSGNPVGECYTYVDGYVFGSVRSADFQIGGEQVAAMPIHVIGDTGQFATAPSSCSSGGGTSIDTVQALGANGIIGVGSTQTDCGAACTGAGGSSAAAYYDCPSSGCSTIIARASSSSAPFQQLPNPVAAFAVDNNGTVLSLPSVAASGAATLTGTVYFGIGTQTNNGLGSATVLTTDSAGFLTATYKGQNLNQSFLDSGSNLYLFTDSTITACTGSGYTGFYCPASPLALTPTLTGQNGVSLSAAFTLYNVKTQPSATANAIPGIGANPNAVSGLSAIPRSFDFGLPFFFGRSVYTAIAGRTAAGTAGPYIAY